MTDVLVRPALPADGPSIARVHVRGWREAHTGHVPSALLDGLDVAASTRRWSARLRGDFSEETEPLGQSWVASVGDEVVGFASAGMARDLDLPATDEELYALYVIADHYGEGIGSALLDAVLGPGAVTLWVLADNPRAHAFYAKHGFRPDGVTRTDCRWGEPLREERWARAARRPRS